MATDSRISWLPEDFTGTSTDNYVQGEVHKPAANGTKSQFVIVPAEGAFYDTKNLKVVYHTNSGETELLRDNDYRLVGIDYGRTKVSSAQGGVYHFILITTALNFSDNNYVKVSYQAFGGYLSAAAYSGFKDELEALKAKIEVGGVITEASLPQSPTIQTIVNQLQSLAARMQYAPSVKYQAKTSYDNTLVWNTVAVSSETYDRYINFTDPRSLQGALLLTLVSDYLTTKVALHYDLIDKPTLGVDVIYQKIYELDTTKYLNDSKFFTEGLMFIPKFRLVVDQSANAVHKVYVQMALVDNQSRDLNMFITDSTDMTMDDVANAYTLTADETFKEGKSYYVREGVDNYYRYAKANVVVGDPVPSDTYYELTNISKIHNATMASKFELCAQSMAAPAPEAPSDGLLSDPKLALKNPYKIWEGNVNLAFIQRMSYTGIEISEEYNVPDKLMLTKTTNGYLATNYLPGVKALELDAINFFVIDVYDRYEERLLVAKLPVKKLQPYALNPVESQIEVAGVGCYYIPDLGTIDIRIRYNNGESSMNIYAKSGKSSFINERFDLRTIYIC